jgi:hypothetical protein
MQRYELEVSIFEVDGMIALRPQPPDRDGVFFGSKDIVCQVERGWVDCKPLGVADARHDRKFESDAPECWQFTSIEDHPKQSCLLKQDTRQEDAEEGVSGRAYDQLEHLYQAVSGGIGKSTVIRHEHVDIFDDF